MEKLLTVLLLLSLLCAPSFAERRVVEHTVVWSSEVNELIDRVSAMGLKGWEPLGGVCYESRRERRFLQSMVKYEEVE